MEAHGEVQVFSNKRALRHYAFGLITGFVAITVLMGLLWISHALVFDGLQLHSAQIATYGSRWLLGLLLVGIAEEGLERGYALTSIHMSVFFPQLYLPRWFRSSRQSR